MGCSELAGDVVHVAIAIYETSESPDWVAKIEGYWYPKDESVYVSQTDTVEEFRRRGLMWDLLTTLVAKLEAKTVNAARTTEASYALFEKLRRELPDIRVIDEI
jgi:hypothetical protein